MFDPVSKWDQGPFEESFLSLIYSEKESWRAKKNNPFMKNEKKKWKLVSFFEKEALRLW